MEGTIDALYRGLVACFRTQIVEQLSNALFAVGILPKWIDYPDLPQVYCGSKSSRFWIIWDEFDVLDTPTLCRRY